MLRVLLVDDEPFIVQGLMVFVDWEQEGYEIVYTAADGAEALTYLKEHKVDLVISDIKMPVMSGLELLETIRRENISDAYFIILSGYSDFSYAQQAIRYECMEYILKPVEKEELLGVLRRVAKVSEAAWENEKKKQKLEHEYLTRNIIALLCGKYDTVNLEYIKSHMNLSDSVRYVYLEPYDIGDMSEQEDGEYCLIQRKLHQACQDFLKEDSSHCFFDVSWNEKNYDIGFIYCDYMAKNRAISEVEYLSDFQESLELAIQRPVKLLAGKKVSDISGLAKSYSTACVLNSLEAFRAKKKMYFYEEEVQIHNGGIILCKQSLDALISAIEQNDKIQIRKCVENLYEEMRQMGLAADTVNLNINYFLFQLIYLATEQDDCVDQKEILHFIGESTFEEGVTRGSSVHMVHFALEYAEYLAQLRKNISRGGVIRDVEKEIRENYAENLTLRELSKKYYVNSAYLGQIFRKKFGQSFKEYLNNYRMEQAVQRLLYTSDKIYQIALDVGYKDCDYFINRFIAAKGCTPAKFRRQGGVLKN